jgi:hypothetical protein
MYIWWPWSFRFYQTSVFFRVLLSDETNMKSRVGSQEKNPPGGLSVSHNKKPQTIACGFGVIVLL